MFLTMQTATWAKQLFDAATEAGKTDLADALKVELDAFALTFPTDLHKNATQTDVEILGGVVGVVSPSGTVVTP